MKGIKFSRIERVISRTRVATLDTYVHDLGKSIR